MRAVFNKNMLVFAPENEEERAAVHAFVGEHKGDVYEVLTASTAVTLRAIGPRAEACNEPINIGSKIANAEWRLISNFARTPFDLDGQTYASVESFWQGLKFPLEADRRRIAPLAGLEAKKCADILEPAPTFMYGDAEIRTGSREHWALMERACEAKFSQHGAARRALLSTGTRPLTHKMRADSRTIPGFVLSDIWMRLRATLREGGADA